MSKTAAPALTPRPWSVGGKTYHLSSIGDPIGVSADVARRATAAEVPDAGLEVEYRRGQGPAGMPRDVSEIAYLRRAETDAAADGQAGGIRVDVTVWFDGAAWGHTLSSRVARDIALGAASAWAAAHPGCTAGVGKGGDAGDYLLVARLAGPFATGAEAMDALDAFRAPVLAAVAEAEARATAAVAPLRDAA